MGSTEDKLNLIKPPLEETFNEIQSNTHYLCRAKQYQRNCANKMSEYTVR